MKFLCKLFGHKLKWIDQIIRCKWCKGFASDIISSDEKATFDEKS